MVGLITTLALLLAAVAALGVLNTVVLTTRERVHDLGVFKAVGITPRQTTAMAVSWVAGIGLVAGVIAVPLGIALHHEILPAMATSVDLRCPRASSTSTARRSSSRSPLPAWSSPCSAPCPGSWAAKIRTATALHAE